MERFFYEAKSSEVADIHIYGVIGVNDQFWGEGTNNTAFALVSLLKNLEKTYKRINIHINSPGGDIATGLAVYNTIKNSKAEIHTYNDGLVASMASIVMLPGKTHMSKTSILHFHSAGTRTEGNINDHLMAIEALSVFESTLHQAIADRSGMDIEAIKTKWFDGKEHYLTADMAMEFGFIDILEEGAVKVPAAVDQLQNMSFEQVTALYNESVTAKKEESFIAKIKSIFSNSNINSKQVDMGKPLVLKAKLAIMLALIGRQEFIVNADNKIELEIDEAFRFNDELEAKDNQIVDLKQENFQLNAQVDALKAKNDLLQSIIDATPQTAANPKGGDNSVIAEPEGEVTVLDDEMSQKIHALNKQNNMYGN